MPKGGARVPSDLFAVGKGMGLDRHYELLSLIGNMTEVTAKKAMVYLNQEFAWWDDPTEQGPTETCRSYLKELWRLGLIQRISPSSKNTININQSNWRGGEQPPTFRISKLGKYLLSKNKGLFAYHIAWCIVNACKSKIYTQVEKLFQLCSYEGYIPINDYEHVKLSKKHGIYVEKHAGKAIKFGWLEPTGLVYRITPERFAQNIKFINYLNYVKVEDLFSGIEAEIPDTTDMLFKLKEKTLGTTSFTSGSKYQFHVEITNNTRRKVTIQIKPYLFSIFSNISRITVPTNITLNASASDIVTFQLESKSIELSGSLMTSMIGYVQFVFNNSVIKLFMPQISIMNEDHIWELELCGLLKQLDLKVFHLTGKSDRPDAVVDLSGLNTEPGDLLGYLRAGHLEKMLIETTLGRYNASKLRADTIKRNTRGLNKYQTHTQYVLKIAAIGQLIAADTFASNIDDHFVSVKEQAKHIITLIDKNALKYLIKKHIETGDTTDVIKLLKSGEHIDEGLINETF